MSRIVPASFKESYAGAIVSGSQGTAGPRAHAPEASGVRVGHPPTQVAEIAVVIPRR